nr:BSR [Brachypodium sp.]
MAGLIVSASTGVLKPLLVKLATLMAEEFAKLKNLRKEVKFISEELTSMKDALERLSDLDELDKQTKGWRDQVREMSYDIEDIIDDFMHHIEEKSETDGLGRKTARLLKKLRSRHQIASQIKEIKALVLETSAWRQRYKLDIPPSSDVAMDPRVKALYEKAANLVGMEGPKNEIVDWLIDEEKQLKVVSIVGFGGLGKTTLANAVYATLKGKYDYHYCAFVPVSQKPNIPNLLRTLLSQLGGTPFPHDCELNILLDDLREHLQNKRYLIIIDDIWTVSAWEIIKCAFPESDLGSRVIVTTRIQEVAAACRSDRRRDYILQMKPLSNEDSTRLFFDRIFGSKQACPQQLSDVSIEILKKCGGLPLAIISISSMLASEGSNQKDRWKHVHDSLGSGTNLTLEGVRKILNLSYKDLPPRLKTCLLYLGMYPEDYEISRTALERQWMAEGFIGKENGHEAEKAARNYFNELVNRSLIQPVQFDELGSVTSCRVHDMMLDLILLKSAQENFFTIVNDPQDFAGLQYKVRRLSIRFDGATARKNGQTIIPKNTSVSQVRSVMFFGSSENTPPLSEFKFLRVFFTGLARSAAVDLSGLCKLYQLRYLSISNGWSYQLPTHIRVLQHLQSLEVPCCDSIPSDMVHLPHLMHLVAYCRLPDEIGNLKSLRSFVLNLNTLDNFSGLGELTNLRYLDLRHNLGDDKEKHMDALCSSLGRLCNLEELYYELDGCMDGLMPLFSPSTPCRLERFSHTEFSWFSRVPSWMGELRNLIYLRCQVGELLADGVGILAELPALTHLDIIRRNDTKEMIVIYGGGAFLALKRFDLVLSSPWHLTFQAGAMPKLQRLVLWYNNGSGSEQNGAGPAGIEHLSALEELSAKIGCKSATESENEKASAESALRSAINMHPNHPRLVIELTNYKLTFFN